MRWMPALDACLGKPANGGTRRCASEWEHDLVMLEAGLSQGREPGDDGSGWRGRRKSLSESERELNKAFLAAL